MKNIICIFIIINCQLSIVNCKAQNSFHFTKKYGFLGFGDVGYNLLQNNDSSYFISADHCHFCVSPNTDQTKYLYNINQLGMINFFSAYPDTIRSLYNFDMKI
jgi:hypothetical protein